MGIYGLGTERSLHDYEVFGGFNFPKCLIQDYTLLVKEPPNPPDWEEQFKTMRKKMTMTWDIAHFKAEDVGDYEFMTLGVIDKFDTNLYRIDFKPQTHPAIFNYTQNSWDCEVMGDHPADKLVMYAFSKKNQWSKRYEKKL
jgi:hypothetical protein